jgi:molybdenum cofactor biosynthesis enzyme MoaA
MDIINKKNLAFVCSDKCQHNCVYCLTKEPWKDKLFEKVKITKTNLILKYIKLFNKYTNEIILTGFEPTLNKDLFKIINFASNNGIDYISLHTNGVLLNRQYLKKLLDFKKFLKIFISFPSANRKNYNLITGSRSFDRVCEALKLLQKMRFLFWVEIVISSLNINDLENTINFLNAIGIKRIILMHVITYKKKYNIFNFIKVINVICCISCT